MPGPVELKVVGHCLIPNSPYVIEADEVRFQGAIAVPIANISHAAHQALSSLMPPGEVAIVRNEDGRVYGLCSDSKGVVSECSLENIASKATQLTFRDSPVSIPLEAQNKDGAVMSLSDGKITLYAFDFETATWNRYLTRDLFSESQISGSTIPSNMGIIVLRESGEIVVAVESKFIALSAAMQRLFPGQFLEELPDNVYGEIEMDVEPPPGAIVEEDIVYKFEENTMIIMALNSKGDAYIPRLIAPLVPYILPDNYDNVAMVDKVAFTRDQHGQALMIVLKNNRLIHQRLDNSVYNFGPKQVVSVIPTVDIEDVPKNMIVIVGGQAYLNKRSIPLATCEYGILRTLTYLDPEFGTHGEQAIIYNDRVKEYMRLLRQPGMQTPHMVQLNSQGVSLATNFVPHLPLRVKEQNGMFYRLDERQLTIFVDRPDSRNRLKVIRGRVLSGPLPHKTFDNHEMLGPLPHKTFDNHEMLGRFAFYQDQKGEIQILYMFQHRLVLYPLSTEISPHLSQDRVIFAIPEINKEAVAPGQLVVVGGSGWIDGKEVPIIPLKENDLNKLPPTFGLSNEVALVYSEKRRCYCLIHREHDRIEMTPCYDLKRSLRGITFLNMLPQKGSLG